MHIFLGSRIARKRMLCLSQASYNELVLACKTPRKVFLPFRHGAALSKEISPKISKEIKDMKAVPYVSAVGSLMYAMH